MLHDICYMIVIWYMLYDMIWYDLIYMLQLYIDILYCNVFCVD